MHFEKVPKFKVSVRRTWT